MIEMGNLWLEVSLKDDFAEGSLGVLRLKAFLTSFKRSERGIKCLVSCGGKGPLIPDRLKSCLALRMR